MLNVPGPFLLFRFGRSVELKLTFCRICLSATSAPFTTTFLSLNSDPAKSVETNERDAIFVFLSFRKRSRPTLLAELILGNTARSPPIGGSSHQLVGVKRNARRSSQKVPADILHVIDGDLALMRGRVDNDLQHSYEC